MISAGNTSSETSPAVSAPAPTDVRNALRAVRNIQRRAIEQRKRKAHTTITVTAQLDEGEDDEPFCRFCFEEETENNPLIAPCVCRGSQKWIHPTCLARWRERWTPNTRRYTHCSVCESPWNVTGPRRLNLGKKYVMCSWMYFVILLVLNLNVLLWFILLESGIENGNNAQWCVPATMGIGMLNGIFNAVASTHLTNLLDPVELCTGLSFFMLNFGLFFTGDRVLVFSGCWVSFVSASVFIGYSFRRSLWRNTRRYLRCC